MLKNAQQIFPFYLPFRMSWNPWKMDPWKKCFPPLLPPSAKFILSSMQFLMGSLEVELWDIWNGGGEAKKLCSMDFCPSFCKKLFLDSSLYVYNDIATLWFVWQFSSCARPTTIYLHYKVLFLKYSKCFKIHNGSNLYNNPYKHFLFVPNLPEFHICIEREATDVVH